MHAQTVYTRPSFSIESGLESRLAPPYQESWIRPWLRCQCLGSWAWLDHFLTGGRVASLSGICSGALSDCSIFHVLGYTSVCIYSRLSLIRSPFSLEARLLLGERVWQTESLFLVFRQSKNGHGNDAETGWLLSLLLYRFSEIWKIFCT